MSASEALTLEEAIRRQRQITSEGFGPNASAASKKFTNNIAMTVIATLFGLDPWADARIKAEML